MHELIDTTKFCDDCTSLSLSENEQNRIKKEKGYAPNHHCKKYKCQVLHLGVHPKILRCGICLKERSHNGIGADC